MWAEPLAGWYAQHGRHHLPWRRTRDPWAVLVSEVMLQQTPVSRVLGRWEGFLDRWPDPAACAAAPLDDVLRYWDGLGYPRRARALHAAATEVAAGGWPAGEAGLQSLPGIGRYTARALLVLAFDAPSDPPRDVNAARVGARAVLGAEAHEVAPSRLDDILRGSRPAAMSSRDHALALFDLGARICTARRPKCAVCPLAPVCASRTRLARYGPGPAARRQARYRGSFRELRGAVLRAMLGDGPPGNVAELRRRLHGVPAAAVPGAVESALASLRHDGLLPADRAVRTKD